MEMELKTEAAHDVAMRLLLIDPEKHLETIADMYYMGAKCSKKDIPSLQKAMREAREILWGSDAYNHVYDAVRNALDMLQMQLDKSEEGITGDEKISITITKDKIGDPEIPIYQVEVRSKEMEGLWRETFGSEEHLQIFLQGLRAAFTFTEVGYISIPEIP